MSSTPHSKMSWAALHVPTCSRYGPVHPFGEPVQFNCLQHGEFEPDSLLTTLGICLRLLPIRNTVYPQSFKVDLKVIVLQGIDLPSSVVTRYHNVLLERGRETATTKLHRGCSRIHTYPTLTTHNYEKSEYNTKIVGHLNKQTRSLEKI